MPPVVPLHVSRPPTQGVQISADAPESFRPASPPRSEPSVVSVRREPPTDGTPVARALAEPAAQSPASARPAVKRFDAETATRAPRDLGVIVGNRTFECLIGAALQLPGTANLNDMSAGDVRHALHAELQKLPLPHIPDDASAAVRLRALRRVASNLAVQTRIRMLAAKPELRDTVRVCLRSATLLQTHILDHWSEMMAATDHPAAARLVDAPRPLRVKFASELAGSVFTKLREGLSGPVEAHDKRDLLEQLHAEKLQDAARRLMAAQIDRLPPGARSDVWAPLRRDFAESFLTHYRQGSDPALRHAGNDGVCYGLSLQWARDGGKLVLENAQPDATPTVGAERGRQVRLMQHAVSLTRQIVSSPAFQFRALRVRATVGDGRPGPGWKNVLRGVHHERFVQDHTLWNAHASDVPETPAVGDFNMPRRVIDRDMSETFDATFVEGKPKSKEDVYSVLDALLGERAQAAAQRLNDDAEATHFVFALKFLRGPGHAVALSVQRSPETGEPRLVFFDSNMGEIAFPKRATGVGLDAFAGFEGFVHAWMNIWEHPCVAVRLSHTLTRAG